MIIFNNLMFKNCRVYFFSQDQKTFIEGFQSFWKTWNMRKFKKNKDKPRISYKKSLKNPEISNNLYLKV